MKTYAISTEYCTAISTPHYYSSSTRQAGRAPRARLYFLLRALSLAELVGLMPREASTPESMPLRIRRRAEDERAAYADTARCALSGIHGHAAPGAGCRPCSYRASLLSPKLYATPKWAYHLAVLRARRNAYHAPLVSQHTHFGRRPAKASKSTPQLSPSRSKANRLQVRHCAPDFILLHLHF